jgi:hypothetical protein
MRKLSVGILENGDAVRHRQEAFDVIIRKDKGHPEFLSLVFGAWLDSELGSGPTVTDP